MEIRDHTTLVTPSLYNEELDRLIAPVSRSFVYPAKEIFQMPEDSIDGIYYIKRGRTRHYMDNNEGYCKILYNLSPGWFFGETMMFLQNKTSLYSQAEVETEVYLIPPEQVYMLMRESELFCTTLFRCFAHKMLILRYEVANLAFNSCKNRLKRLLCSAADVEHPVENSWYNLQIHYTHSELGEIVGGARVTISRQLSELCNEGFIRMINRKIQLNIQQYNQYMSRS